MVKLFLGISIWLNMATVNTVKECVASYYHDSLHGAMTANGEIYDKDKLSCAHKTLPFGTILIVRNVNNNKSTIVRVNDRGPFIDGREIDLSREAARRIRMIDRGVVVVEYKIIYYNGLE